MEIPGRNNERKYVMIGAIIGDIVGSRFEFNNHKSKDFSLFSTECSYTDDSVMTLALGDAILRCNGDYSKLQSLGPSGC